MTRALLFVGFMLLLATQLCASHIMGGNLAVVAKPTNGHTIRLSLWYDELSTGTNPATVTVSIFRKRDHFREADYTLSNPLASALPFANTICNNSIKISPKLVIYSTDVTLSLNDSEGYYVVWEQCCRNGSLANIEHNNMGNGFVFYAEIPPTTNPNNSPEFKTPVLELACQNKPLTIDFGANDAEKDELKYSLVTPLNGFSDVSNANPKAKAGPYPRIAWQNGYDSTKIVNGSLTVDEKTGLVLFKAAVLGQYVFTVRCEEFRNGKKIGEIRREWVVVVVDCVPRNVPTAIITQKAASTSVTFQTNANKHIESASLCPADSLILKAEDEDPRWAYQWQHNGTDLVGATKTFLKIDKAGQYTLIKKYSAACGTDTPALATTDVVFKVANVWKLSSTKKNTVCDNDSSLLEITPKPSLQSSFLWFQNGQPLPITVTQIYVKKAGVYKVLVTDHATKCANTDSIVIRTAISPMATLTATGSSTFCSSDSVKLLTTNSKQYDYNWFLNNAPILSAISYQYKPSLSGTYIVEITDTLSKCSARTNAVTIIIKQSPVVALDSIPPLCSGGTQAVTLNGKPTGGKYESQYVLNNRFVSLNLQPGRYPVMYQYTNEEGCTGIATRVAVIMLPPKIKLPSGNLMIKKGDSIEIKAIAPLGASVRWSPTDGLSNPTQQAVRASPEQTTTYAIKITTPDGCIANENVTILVLDIEIPDGFSPNNDNVNDTWQIKKIKDFPNCIVEIYNRWGNLLFASKGYELPWDGRWNNQIVPTDTYFYRIYFRETDYTLNGSILVLK